MSFQDLLSQRMLLAGHFVPFRFVPSLVLLLLVGIEVPTASAATTIVSDDFASYADDNALYAVWEPRKGNGAEPPAVLDDGILTTDDTLFPGIEGQGVDHLGGSVMQYTGLAPGSEILPSATESVHVQGDIYVGNDGNSRMSIGLRNRSVPENLLELGTWNDNDDEIDSNKVIDPFDDPTDGVTLLPVTTYAFRLILFENGTQGEGMFRAPNWQFFQLDPALDTTPEEGEADGIVGPLDIGAAWHRYSATIPPGTITVELDLYRDGLDNGASLTSGSDVAGVDASQSYDIATTAAGFDSLRIGAPSGISTVNGVAFDNVSLALIDVGSGGAPEDLNGDGFVDGLDLGIQLSNFNQSGVPPEGGELNGADPVDGLDLGILLAAWDPPPAVIVAIPEPGSLSLACLAVAGMLAARRR